MARKQTPLRLDDDLDTWIRKRAKDVGLSANAFIVTTLDKRRTQEAVLEAMTAREPQP